MIDTPQGVKALLFEEASMKERFEETILGVFHLWGYSQVTTPSVEYLHVLSKGLDEIGKKRVITFIDPAGGDKPLALRSDVTPQIARIAATTLKNRPAPLRLSYAETVFRRSPQGDRKRMEVYQAGAELIGVDSPEADAEMIAMGIESLSRLGYNASDIKVAISHVGYVKALMEEADLSAEEKSNVKEALTKKDTKALIEVLDKAGAKNSAREMLEALPSLFGDVDVLKNAKAPNSEAKNAIENVKEVVSVLKLFGLEKSLTIDLSEIRGFGYYTGLTFEAFITGMPKRVFSGGRYDTLLSSYGQDMPATGFAIDIDHLLETSSITDWTSADILVIAEKGQKLKAVKAAESLRKRGLRVARDIGLRDTESSIKSAEKMKIPVVIVTTTDLKSEKDKVRVINIATGEDHTISVEQLYKIISE